MPTFRLETLIEAPVAACFALSLFVGVTSVNAPHRFLDEQLRGPFASWRHEHLFAEHDEATMMVDQIRFRSPLGPAGTLVDRTVLGRYMTRLVQQRNTWLKTTLESEPPTPRQ